MLVVAVDMIVFYVFLILEEVKALRRRCVNTDNRIKGSSFELIVCMQVGRGDCHMKIAKRHPSFCGCLLPCFCFWAAAYICS